MAQIEEGKSTDGDMANRLDMVITAMNKLIVNVTSYGFDDPSMIYSKIMINGQNFTQSGRGVHVVDIETESLVKTLYGSDKILCIDEIELKKFVKYARFDTYGQQKAGQNFLNHLQAIKNTNIDILSVQDSADKHWPKDAFAYFRYNLKMDGMRNLDSIGFRESFVLIGRSGIKQDYTSCYKKEKGDGPAMLNVVIPITKNT